MATKKKAVAKKAAPKKAATKTTNTQTTLAGATNVSVTPMGKSFMVHERSDDKSIRNDYISETNPLEENGE